MAELTREKLILYCLACQNLPLKSEAAASSPPRRPVGTGSLPVSEQEAVPDIKTNAIRRVLLLAAGL